MKPVQRKIDPRRVSEDLDVPEELTLHTIQQIDKNTEEDTCKDYDCVLRFLCEIAGWKVRTKNLHWSARCNDIHTRLDEFYDVLEDFEDKLAESYLGIEGHTIYPTEITCEECDAIHAIDLIDDVKKKTCEFYKNLPDDVIYAGIRSETETLITNITKYNYLFRLCKC